MFYVLLIRDMIQKTLYVPGFGNYEEEISQKRFDGDAEIIQENLRQIASERINAFKEKHAADLYRVLNEKYPSTTDSDLKKAKGRSQISFTRDIPTTVNLTVKKIEEYLETNDSIKIAGHSQGGLVIINSIIQKPLLLANIKEIELLAPVMSFQEGGKFHQGKQGYVHGKGVVIRDSFINSFKDQSPVFEKFLVTLKDFHWKGKLKIVLGEKDPVVNVDQEMLNQVLKDNFPDAEVEIIENGDHYLGYKTS